ncbi:MAG TPA: hypothetical protein QGF41_12940, partial [Gammaproteobacteria bacterium]|nr:hypothetical protein [Gammaproteobacteria bacterium]
MNTLVVSFLGILLLAAVAAVLQLMRQTQQARLEEVTARERLAAKQAEMDRLLESMHKAESDNESLKNDIQNYREQI